ncbi:MAG TPA: RHS repeat protein, partial [Ghiorsea sp.]|nr:RHS repeat protein [Ghiorsea sp.]
MPKKPSDKEQAMFDELQAWMDQGEQQNVLTPSSLQQLHYYSQTHPAETKQEGVLGSRYVGLIRLHTRQFEYVEDLMTLAGNLPLHLRLRYLSRSSQCGAFGKSFHLNYASTLIPYEKGGSKGYSLCLDNGQCFHFKYDIQQACYQDVGGLGATLLENTENTESTETTLIYHDGRQHVYKNGLLTSLRDRNKNSITLTHTAAGHIATISNNSGASLRFDYDDKTDQVHQVQDHGGRVWSFKYSAQNHLEKIITPLGTERHFEYQPPIKTKASHTTPDRLPHNFYLLSTVKDSQQHTLVECKYNQQGEATVIREQGMGTGTLYTYSNENISVKTEGGKETLYHLDRYGLIDSIFYDNETHHDQRWGAKNRCLRYTTGTKTMTTEYDDRHRIIRKKDSDQRKIAYTYTGNNPFPSTISSEKGILRHHYDAAFNLLSREDEKKRHTKFEYNEWGNVTESVDVDGYVTRTKYNDQHAPIKVNEQTFSYDIYQREIHYADAEDKALALTYNTHNQLTQITSGSGSSTQLSYSQEGQLESIGDAHNNRHQFHYNTSGILQQSSLNGHLNKAYQSNQAGYVTQIRREDGSTVYYEYDHKGRLSKETIGSMVTQYEFNDLDQLSRVHDLYSDLHFEYDNQGQQVVEVQNGVRLESSYVKQQKVTLRYADQSCHYQRDAHGELQSITRNSHDTLSINQHYSASEQLLKREYPNGTVEKITYD